MLDCHYYEETLKHNVGKISQYNDASNYFGITIKLKVNFIVASKTHQELLYAVQTKLPRYFKFESVGILFFDKRGNCKIVFIN